MKILFIVVGAFNPLSGVGKTSFSLACRLSSQHDMTVFASSRDPSIPPSINFRRFPFWQTGKNWSYYLPLPLIWNFLLASWLGFINSREYDIVHIFNGLAWSNNSLITLQICQRGAIRNSGGLTRWERIRKNSPKHLLLLAFEWLVYRWGGFKKLVVCSRFEKDEIIKYYRTDPIRIVVLYNGIDPRPLPTRAERLCARRKLEFLPGDAVCLFIGYDLKRKGLETAIQALSYLPDRFKLVVVGGEDSKGKFRSTASRLGVSGRISFRGQHRDLADFFSAADLLVLPTRYEPFGTVVAEAMGWGLPVVISRAAGAAELVTEGREGFLIENPRDSKEIAGLIHRAFSEDRVAFSENARETALKSTWEIRARELEDIYRKINNGGNMNGIEESYRAREDSPVV